MAVTIIEAVDSPGERKTWAGWAVAWGGALLFVASLGYFLVTYALTFGENQQTGTAGPAIAWNFGLFTVFALHHSVFARTRVRAVVARTVPASLERSVYVWAAAAVVLPLANRRLTMRSLYIGSLIVLAAACGGGVKSADSTAATSATTDADPAVKAANVANAIAANPAGADSILTANGYTRESFDKQLLDIAADSAMSARYAAAKAK